MVEKFVRIAAGFRKEYEVLEKWVSVKKFKEGKELKGYRYCISKECFEDMKARDKLIKKLRETYHRECEKCGVVEGSEEYMFELSCVNGEMLCEDCQDEEEEDV